MLIRVCMCGKLCLLCRGLQNENADRAGGVLGGSGRLESWGQGEGMKQDGGMDRVNLRADECERWKDEECSAVAAGFLLAFGLRLTYLSPVYLPHARTHTNKQSTMPHAAIC